MGLVTGFLSGATLTSLTLFLTLSQHRRNRLEQSQFLHDNLSIFKSRPQSSTHLSPAASELNDNILSPPLHSSTLAQSHHESLYGAHHPDTDRLQRDGLVERAKGRWNEELTSSIKRVQDTDWSAVWSGLEHVVAAGWAAVRRTGHEGIKEADKSVRDAATRLAHSVEDKVSTLPNNLHSIERRVERASKSAIDTLQGRVTDRRREGY